MEFHISEEILTNDRNHLQRSGKHYLILFPMSGCCLLGIHGKEYACASSDLVLLVPSETVTLENRTEKGDMIYLSIRVSEELMEELSGEDAAFREAFAFAPYPVSVIHTDAKACALLRNLIQGMRPSSEEAQEQMLWGRELYRRCLFTSFLIHFLRACIDSDRVHVRNQHKELIIDDVFLYIRRHLTDELTLAVLEKEFFVSASYLSRKFRESTGIGLHAYIQQARIDLGKKYLLQGYPVSQVYSRCGFTSYNHFFRVFKKVTGMTPMEFVRQLTYG